MALTQISTAGVKDDAVTSGKIPANAVGSSELADDAVDTAAIADDAVTTAKIADNAVTLAKLEHGTSSNDGKFLRANNGADPTFETVSGTTINNNADNRVITGSGTANTLNGESLVTIDSNGKLSVSPSTGGSGITLASGGSTFGGVVNLINTQGSNHQWQLAVGGGDNAYVLGRGFFIRDETTGANRLHINTNGKVGINELNPQQQLHVHNDTSYQGIFVNGNGAPRVGFARSTTTTGEWSVGIDGTNGTQFVINNSNDNSNRKLILSSTGVSAAGTLTSGGHCTAYGNFVVGTAGNGIDFSATADPSGHDNSLLDDYEEGSWTPTFDGTWTNLSASNVRHAKYTKIGNTVHYYMEFWATGNNGGWETNSNLRGFPYGTPQSYYAPVNIAVMYGPSSYSMDQTAAGRAYFDGFGDRLYLNMGSFSGVRHLWIQITITNAT